MDFQIKKHSSSGKGGMKMICEQIQSSLHSLLCMHGKTVCLCPQANSLQTLLLSLWGSQPMCPPPDLPVPPLSLPNSGEGRHSPPVSPVCSPGTRVSQARKGQLATFVLAVCLAAVTPSLVHTRHATQASTWPSTMPYPAVLSWA